MSFNATVSAGWTYTTGDTVTASTINQLGLPTVTVPDNKSYVFAAGSVGAPSHSFNGDSDTGIFSSAVDTVNVAAAGVEQVRITTQGIGSQAGTVSLPSFTFIGDGDTGFYHPAANQIGATVNATQVGLFTTSGLSITGTLDATAVTVGGTSVLTAGISTTRFVRYTDFEAGVTAAGFTSSTSGGGAVAANDAIGLITATDGATGVIKLTVAASSGDRAVIAGNTCLLEQNGTAIFRIRTPGALSTGGARYYVIVGFRLNSSATLSLGSEYAYYFSYDDATSAQWQTVTRNYTTTETQTTATTVAVNTLYRLEIRRTSSSYQFYINNSLVTTHSTQVPNHSTSSIAIAPVFIICTSTAGVAATLYADSFEVNNPYTRT